MLLSIFDIFKPGIGPSSSHTVGPMRAAARFLNDVEAAGHIGGVEKITVSLLGSLAFTGKGHHTDYAILCGLLGFAPETFEPEIAQQTVSELKKNHQLPIKNRIISFNPLDDLIFDYETTPRLHPNEMVMTALDGLGATLYQETYCSVGGGFIATQKQLTQSSDADLIAREKTGKYSFYSAAELLSLCENENLTIFEILMANEEAHDTRAAVNARLDTIWATMDASIERGLVIDGILPGGLEVQRRAPAFYKKLRDNPGDNEREQLFDWLNVYAMAVNEENAAGGRVVTAPTNGAAGVIPAVIKYYCADDSPNSPEKIRLFLVTAAAIGMLFKQRASISGAEMGCQGEVGVACSMAAGGLAAVWGGEPAQIERAAEIAMEHNLGLTCDPVKGLVQIPCIERNAIGAVKAVNAARLALRASYPAKVSLDQVIETMRQTGLDMSNKYKETSQGGLAVNVVEC